MRSSLHDNDWCDTGELGYPFVAEEGPSLGDGCHEEIRFQARNLLAHVLSVVSQDKACGSEIYAQPRSLSRTAARPVPTRGGRTACTTTSQRSM